MAKKYRALRCPNCTFEHPTFGKETTLGGSRPSTPWNCPLCHWSGEVLADRTMTRRPPEGRKGIITRGSN